MPKCSFCGENYEFPRGLTLALNDGVVLHFCSSKCRKNFKLGRKSKKTEWVRKLKHTRAEEELVKEIKEEASEKEEKKEKKEEKAQEKKTEKKEAVEEKKVEKKEEKAEKKGEKVGENKTEEKK